jgi:hypothetical protein
VVLKSSSAVCQADRACRIHCRCAPDRGTSHAPTDCGENKKPIAYRHAYCDVTTAQKACRQTAIPLLPRGRGADRNPASSRRAWERTTILLLPGGRGSGPRSCFCPEGVEADHDPASARRAWGRPRSRFCPEGVGQTSIPLLPGGRGADLDPASTRRAWERTTIPLLPGGRGADLDPASARRAWEHSEVTTDAMERAAVLNHPTR